MFVAEDPKADASITVRLQNKILHCVIALKTLLSTQMTNQVAMVRPQRCMS